MESPVRGWGCAAVVRGFFDAAGSIGGRGSWAHTTDGAVGALARLSGYSVVRASARHSGSLWCIVVDGGSDL